MDYLKIFRGASWQAIAHHISWGRKKGRPHNPSPSSEVNPFDTINVADIHIQTNRIHDMPSINVPVPAYEFGSIDTDTKKQQEIARTNVERYLAQGYLATKGMSSLFAAKIATTLLLSQTEIGIHGHVAEIGVYKGRFFIALALSIAEGECAIAIDAWAENLYESFSRNLGLQGVPIEVVTTIKGDTYAFDFAYFDSLIGGDSIRFIHVDGDHHRQGLFNDLKIAARKLHDAGIICVDDMFHPCYPVLGEAVQLFLRDQSEFIVFCVIDRNDIVEAGKFLICRKTHAARYADMLSKLFPENIFMLPADFETFSAIVLTPAPRSIDL